MVGASQENEMSVHCHDVGSLFKRLFLKKIIKVKIFPTFLIAAAVSESIEQQNLRRPRPYKERKVENMHGKLPSTK